MDFPEQTEKKKRYKSDAVNFRFHSKMHGKNEATTDWDY